MNTLRHCFVALLLLVGIMPGAAAAAPRQVLDGTTTIVFTQAYLDYVAEFAGDLPAVSAFGTATMTDPATVVLPIAPGPFLTGAGVFDTGYGVYQHGGAGFTLLGEGIAYLYDPLFALGNLAGTPFDIGGNSYLAAGIAASDGSVIPTGPAYTAAVFLIPVADVVGSGSGNQLTLSNIRLTFPGGFGDVDTIAVATSVIQLSAVPEPATWLMMIGGFGLAGVALRRQPKRTLPAVTVAATS